MFRKKYVWDIFKEGKNIIVTLNGDHNCTIDTTLPDTSKQKANKLGEIQFWSNYVKTKVKGMRLLM